MNNNFNGVFTLGQTFDRGVQLFRLGIKKIILLITGFALISILFEFLNLNGYFIDSVILIMVVTFVRLFFIAWFYVILTRLYFKISQGEQDISFAQMIRLAEWSDLKLIITVIIFYLVLVLGLILLVIPGLYIANISGLWMIVSILEKEYYFAGLKKTIKLVKHRWWKTFVVNVISMIIIGIPFFVIYGIIASYFLGKGSIIDLLTNPAAINEAIKSPVALIVMILLSVLGYIAYTLYYCIFICHYNSLKSEKEHSDIARELDDLPGELKEIPQVNKSGKE